ncbi:MAG: phosphoesterase [Fimbriiglobus sp.]|jgi:predicted NUDIX family phosphoesterase|nr:phosphoesterase [Fimbriiglobus sp.]
MPTSERVLCIPRSQLNAAGSFHGFRPTDSAFAAKLLNPASFSYRPRSEVETDPSYKQLIPYVVLRCEGEVFHYRRGGSGTEARLHAKRSIGIGGHINPSDGTDAYTAGMLRELHEEVAIGTHTANPPIGFINDDSTPVGQVHLGVVHVFELSEPHATAREASIADGGFATVSMLLQASEQFETWSQFVLQELGSRADY